MRLSVSQLSFVGVKNGEMFRSKIVESTFSPKITTEIEIKQMVAFSMIIMDQQIR